MDEQDYRCGADERGEAPLPIVLTGCSGGGKSTLLGELSRLGHNVQPEPGRQIVKEELSIGSDGVPWANAERFMQLTLSRAMHLYNAAPRDGIVFVDRSIVDCACAYEYVRGRVPEHVARAVARYRYHESVFMVPPWERIFSTDDERRHSFAEAVEEYERLVPFYREHEYRVLEVPIGPVRDRADFVTSRLSG